MEIKKEKCSFIDHKDIEAIYYCIICKVYMCHKCESFHSKLCQQHKIINCNEVNINDFFTGFCKENNHQSELEYFCRTHNHLVCAKCIVRIHDKKNGNHSDCNICTLKEIKDEKINYLKNNINLLQNLSENLTESINKLKKIYEDINQEKEQLKLKVQKLFTKIRNELNNKEDQLLSNIDDLFEKNFIKEEIMKNSEKLPKKIKLILEKIKSFDKNDEYDVNSIINDSIIIEKNINNINNINKIINNSNNLINKKIKLFPDNDNEINQVISKIESSIEISIIPEKYSFKFDPKLGNNYQVSENGLTITKKGKDSWDCVILGDKEIPKNLVSNWKIKLKNICDYKSNSWSILIGISPKYDGSPNFHHKCWSFICGESTINIKNKVSRCVLDKERLKSGSIIEVILDRAKGYLSFIVNGKNCGIVDKEIPKDENLYPFVSIYDNDQIVELIE